MGEPRIVFVSREVYPFDSAGLGNYVLYTAAALAPHAEVTILTTDLHEPRYHELRAAGDARLPEGVAWRFIPEPRPEEAEYWYTALHLWSARALEAIAGLHPDGGPHLVEFPDYLGEACVTAQARQTLDRRLRHTRVCVRAYTTAELCAVLDGFSPGDRDGRLAFDLERFALRHCDHFLWPGGGVLDAYRQFYGERGVAAPVEVGHVAGSAGVAPAEPAAADGITRFLYLGRLERRKGVNNLVRAATSMAGEDWSLTLVGGDTPTAPLGGSMRRMLELTAAEDPRISLPGRVPHERIGELLATADVVVSPSLWECWPNTVLEAFEHDRPVLATPVGGHVGMVERGRSGWLCDDTSSEALIAAMEAIVATAPGDRPVEPGAPRRRFERLTDPEPVRERYLELAAGAREAPAPRDPAPPLVTVVIPYFRMERYVEETLASVAAQTHPRIETIVVNDGSLRAEDAEVETLAARYGAALVTQPNSGLGQARNLGIDLARGRYVLPLDPDDTLAPTFVARAVEVLERRPELAYVTAWSEFIDEDGIAHGGGYRPLGNDLDGLDAENLAGSAMSVFRRRLFERGLRYSPDLTSYEDWHLFWRLRRDGAFGHVIPEPLLQYRIRRGSMLREVTHKRRARLRGELEAHKREAEVRWTFSSV